MKRLSYAIPFIAIVSIGLAIYSPMLGFDFVCYDDPEYVSDNPHVLQGLTAENFRWGWTTTRMGQWHPFVWWSYQIDVQIFGQTPWGFHLTNLVLHLTGTCLLFTALRWLQIDAAAAFVVAALYCAHPLHVESVAWISERKGILSSVFWFAGMLAYAWYVRCPNWFRMAFVVLAMAGGLMAKQMLVAFPIALLLLDIWPLARLRWRGEPGATEPKTTGAWLTSGVAASLSSVSLRQAILEKLPLFVLSLVFCGITFYTQASEGAVNSVDQIPLLNRLLNVPGTYAFTLFRTFWPNELTVIYLPPPNLAALAIVGVACLLFITYLAWRYRETSLAFLVGWLWFLGCLFPLSGIVPLGSQWTADRYTDIPLVGIYLMIAQIAILLAKRFSIPVSYLRVAAGALIVLLCALSMRQLSTWRDGDTLMRHAIKINPDNYIALPNLASELIKRQKFDEAFELLDRTVTLAPNHLQARNDLGLVLTKLGRPDLALEHYQYVIKSDSNYAEAYVNLGNYYLAIDREKSLEFFREAVRRKPDYSEAHNNLGAMLAKSDPATAQQHYERSLALRPDNADAHCNLANLLARAGKWERAIEQYKLALEIDEHHATARRNLRIVLQSRQQGAPATSP